MSRNVHSNRYPSISHPPFLLWRLGRAICANWRIRLSISVIGIIRLPRARRSFALIAWLWSIRITFWTTFRKITHGGVHTYERFAAAKIAAWVESSSTAYSKSIPTTPSTQTCEVEWREKVMMRSNKASKKACDAF